MRHPDTDLITYNQFSEAIKISQNEILEEIKEIIGKNEVEVKAIIKNGIAFLEFPDGSQITGKKLLVPEKLKQFLEKK